MRAEAGAKRQDDFQSPVRPMHAGALAAQDLQLFDRRLQDPGANVRAATPVRRIVCQEDQAHKLTLSTPTATQVSFAAVEKTECGSY